MPDKYVAFFDGGFFMDEVEYEFLYERLNDPEDVEKLCHHAGYSKDLLFNILAKKVVRRTLKMFYVVKAREDELFLRWKRGESILKLAKHFDFSPILMASFILKKRGLGRKQINCYVKDPDSMPDLRIRNELKEIVKADFVYSPWAFEIQKSNGQNAEQVIKEWLDARGIKYKREKEIKATHRKTPDFLLEKPVIVQKRKVFWFESKGSFGDKREMIRDYKKQFKPYLDLFGLGVVVYHLGFIENAIPDPRILFVDASFLK